MFWGLQMGVSKNMGFYPQIIHFNRVFPYKSSILGYHYCWRHPNTFPGCNLDFAQKPCFRTVAATVSLTHSVALGHGRRHRGRSHLSFLDKPRKCWIVIHLPKSSKYLVRMSLDPRFIQGKLLISREICSAKKLGQKGIPDSYIGVDVESPIFLRITY